jgi:hypothetical protein
MELFYTLLICLPAALVLIACACGVAILSPLGTRPAEPLQSADGVAEGVQHDARKKCKHL